ncbi:hypothetical protein NONI108955_40950 [Nocardia ninae]|uniref:Uncharacterized protein n=1 Tax=Nocardia ninae NBRC 108245 TaxID=1210091 RepID=A0A511MF32_9NOCA|nr:hypothetical protein NN4_37890 [Nocardia ninae NBRC 108245]
MRTDRDIVVKVIAQRKHPTGVKAGKSPSPSSTRRAQCIFASRRVGLSGSGDSGHVPDFSAAS